MIHEAGFVYNDLKPENLLTEYRDKSTLKQLKISRSETDDIYLALTDLGFITRYTQDKKGGPHIQPGYKKYF